MQNQCISRFTFDGQLQISLTVTAIPNNQSLWRPPRNLIRHPVLVFIVSSVIMSEIIVNYLKSLKTNLVGDGQVQEVKVEVEVEVEVLL